MTVAILPTVSSGSGSEAFSPSSGLCSGKKRKAAMITANRAPTHRRRETEALWVEQDERVLRGRRRPMAWRRAHAVWMSQPTCWVPQLRGPPLHWMEARRRAAGQAPGRVPRSEPRSPCPSCPTKGRVILKAFRWILRQGLALGAHVGAHRRAIG